MRTHVGEGESAHELAVRREDRLTVVEGAHAAEVVDGDFAAVVGVERLERGYHEVVRIRVGVEHDGASAKWRRDRGGLAKHGDRSAHDYTGISLVAEIRYEMNVLSRPFAFPEEVLIAGAREGPPSEFFHVVEPGKRGRGHITSGIGYES